MRFTVERALVVLPLAALTACSAVLGLGDLKDRLPDGGSTPVIVDDASSSPDAAADAGRNDAGWPAATSCLNGSGIGLGDCGPGGNEGCCSTRDVAGGTHSRGNNATYPATVTSYRLDRFEVTVGRFRIFIDALIDGWKPAAGSGKHAHLNGGQGLTLISGGYELGWNDAWNDRLATMTHEKWTEALSCGSLPTWTDAPGPGDTRPASCMSWYEAYAFCIWDGGFLPSEAEWSYAAAGGAEQRELPWSNPPSSSAEDCAHANFDGPGFGGPPCVDAGAQSVGLTSPQGDGKWGQADLAGNVYEWNLDAFVSQYSNPCVDCADTSAPNSRVARGGAFTSPDDNIFTSFRRSVPAAWRLEYVGLRCARPL